MSSNSYSVHRSLLIIMWHVFYVRSRCFCLFFCFRLLQMDFKMLNSQSANITFHLKQSHSFVRLYSQVGVSVCVSDDVFTISFTFSFSFEISIRRTMSVCERVFFIVVYWVLLSPYNSHTIHVFKIEQWNELTICVMVKVLKIREAFKRRKEEMKKKKLEPILKHGAD